MSVILKNQILRIPISNIIEKYKISKLYFYNFIVRKLFENKKKILIKEIHKKTKKKSSDPYSNQNLIIKK